MTWKAEVSDSAVCKARRYYNSPSRQQKNEGEIFFFRASRLYTLSSAVAVPLQNTSRRRCSLIQPLDVTFNKPFKSEVEKLANEHIQPNLEA